MRKGRLSTLTKYKVKVVEKNGITLSQSLVQRDPFTGWPCCRECGVCVWKPEQNTEEKCNLQNVVYKGICTTCEEKGDERLAQIKEDNPNIEDVEALRISTEYIRETCKSIHTRSSKHFNQYRLLEKDSFILNHHMKCHQDTKLGEVKVRFETHRKQ